MPLTEIIPAASAIAVIGFAVFVTGRDHKPSGNIWISPAITCLAFIALSIAAIRETGLTGFWPNHTQDYWGNQVWVDLLLAIGVAWVLILPHMRKLRMNPWPWLIFTACTGSIGLLATLARMLYLRERNAEGALASA